MYRAMQNFVKIGPTRYHVFSIFKSAFLDFQIFKFLVADQIETTNVHRYTNFVKIVQWFWR